jgi:hypothetical protein
VPYVVAEPCVDVKDKHALTSAMNVYSRPDRVVCTPPDTDELELARKVDGRQR